MPNIVVHIPHGAFAGEARSALTRCINEAAAKAEQMPADPNKRFVCWVVVNEVDPGALTCGSVDMTAQLLPCIAMVHVPAGVLDGASRTRYVQEMHDAFREALPAGELRKLITSVVLHDVADGTWGANGVIWRLPDLAKASGHGHLQHLVVA
ncbi:tautomerase [Methylibium sp.]|uniref:tautomerase n=1 Tax=Methylibium sp. TaxID=2067992 RepID=UPI003D137832